MDDNSLEKLNRKRILYLSNIEVPYRVRFFEELSRHCDLTVLYEREKSENRDAKWAASEQSSFRRRCLKGIRIGNENAFSLGILSHITGKYDAVVVGCCNSPVQLLAILVMRLRRIRYILNVDGEVFLDGNGLKTKLKRFFLRGADCYLAAGECAARSLRDVAGDKKVYPYYFSSLTEKELLVNRWNPAARDDFVLVIGQYFGYKGMDIALEAAKNDPSVPYKFVGMGNRTELFRKEHHIDAISNVRLIPFLQKKELEAEYKRCAAVVLPSRQECWGLVINEAASFGTPIVSTRGSGAAVEFLAERYPQYLAGSGDPEDLLRCIRQLREDPAKDAYSAFLLDKSSCYSIERSVRQHLKAFDNQ